MHLRLLRADEGLAYRAARLQALAQAPEAFGQTLAEALAEPIEGWHELAARTAEDDATALFVLDRGDDAPGAPAAAEAGDAIAGTRIAGTLYVRVDREPPYLAHLGALWVDEDVRGGEWADALLDRAEGWARAMGAPGALLWIASGNERAWRFCSRHGYGPTGAIEAGGAGGGEAMELYHAFAG